MDKIFVNVHYHRELVEEFVKQSGYADKVTLLFEDELLGTAGTLVKYRDLYNDAPLMLIHADNLSVFSFDSFYQFHLAHRHQGQISMMTFTTDQPKNCGIVELDDNGKLLAFHEKVEQPPGDQANAAIFWLEPALIASLPTSVTEFSLDVLPQQLGNIWCWHNTVYHRDIGNIESLSLAQIDAPNEIDGPVSKVWLDYWDNVVEVPNKKRFEG